MLASLRKNVGNHSHRIKVDQVKNIGRMGYSVYKVIDVYQNSFQKPNSERYYAYINAEGMPVKFEVDLGFGFTNLPRKQIKTLNLNKNLVQTNLIFRSYTQNTFAPDGKVRVKI